MLCKVRRTTIAVGSAAMIASLMVIALMMPTALAAEVPDDAYIEDQGDFWGVTLQFVFAGSDAQSVEWDFGDGSPVSTEWNPRHTYVETGEYIVTQTVYNSFDGGSYAYGYYKVNVLGAPYVELIQPDGAPALNKVYAILDDDTTDAHRTIVQPTDPVWAGHEFQGWFADAEMTVEFDWTQKLFAPVNAYASWSNVAPIVVEHTLTIKGDDGTVVDTITVQDGRVVTIPEAPEGKTVEYYTDVEMTVEFDVSIAITSDITIYQKISDVIVPVDGGIVITGTELVLIAGIIILGVATVTTRSRGIALITLILVAIAALGILDVVDLPEIIKGFEGVRL